VSRFEAQDFRDGRRTRQPQNYSREIRVSLILKMLLPKMVFSSGEAKDYDLPKNPSSLYFAQDPRTMLVL
jgi:hypothetical protein